MNIAAIGGFGGMLLQEEVNTRRLLLRPFCVTISKHDFDGCYTSICEVVITGLYVTWLCVSQSG